VRDALLRLARADADATLARADQEDVEVLGAADAQARDLLDRARAQAAEDAAALLRSERSRMLQQERSVELRARRATYDALVAAATAAARDELAEDPAVAAALAERARATLGPQAVLTRTPDGGLAAEADGRTLLLPLTPLVEAAVADLLVARGPS
jgi:hypothetical protein